MAEEFTAKFKVDISDLKKNISEANKEIKLANATFKSQTAGMEKWSKDANGLSEKLKQLKTVLSNQKTILSSYENQLTRQKKAYAENGSRIEQLKAKLQELAKNGVAKTDAEYQKYEKALRAVIKEQDNNAKACDDLKLKVLNQKATIGQTEASIEKYTQAQRNLEAESKSLTKTVSDQQTKLSQLKSKYIDVATAEGKDSVAAKKLASEIKSLSTDLNANQRELAESENAANKLDKSFDKAEKSSSGLASKLAGGIKKGFAVAATSLAAVGATAIASGKKMFDMSKQVAETGDNIDKMSQKIGISKKAYQEWDYVFDRSGANVDNLQTGMKKLSTVIVDAAKGSDKAQEKLSAIGLSIDDLNGKSQDEQLSIVIERLQQMGSGAERTAAASALLGKSATDMNAVLNMSVEETAALKKEAEDYGMVMSDDAVSASANFKDSLTKLSGTMGGLKNRIVGALLPGITQVMDGFSDLIAGGDDADKKLEEGFSSIVENITSAASKITPVLGSLLSSLLKQAPSLFQQLVSGISQLLPTLLPLAAQAVATILTGLAAQSPNILSSLLSGLQIAFGTLVRALPRLVQSIASTLPTLIPMVITAAVNMVTTLAKNISSIIQPLIKVLPSVLLSVATSLMDNLPTLIQGAISLVLGLVDALPQVLTGLLDALPTAIESVVTGLLNSLPILIDGAVQLVTSLVEHLPEILLSLIQAAPQILTSIGSALFNAAPALWQSFTKIFSGAWNIIKSVFSAVGSFFSGIFSNAWTAIKNVFSKVGEFFSGIWEGIKKPFQSVVDWFKGVFQNAWEGVKKVFETGGKIFTGIKDGIVTAFKVIVNGIIEGINKVVAVPFNGINTALGALRGLDLWGWKPFEWLPELQVPQIPKLEQGGVLKRGQVGLLEGNGAEAVVPLDKNKPWIRALASSLLGELKSGGNGTVNNSSSINKEVSFTQIINAPQQPSRIEIYRQTKNLLSYANATGAV